MMLNIKITVLSIILGCSIVGIITNIYYKGYNEYSYCNLILFVVSFITILIFFISMKKLEEELTVTNDRLNGVFNNMSSGLAVYKPTKNNNDFIILDFNPSAEKITKVKKENIIGKRLTEVFPNMATSPLFNELKNINIIGKNNYIEPFYYEDNIRKGWRENRIYKLPSGEIVAIFDDVTDRKKAEHDKYNLQNQLNQVHKMEVIGNLAGRIAHDYNNMLNVILGYTDLITESVNKQSKVYKYTNEIKKAASKIQDLTEKLLIFSRKQIVSPKKIDLNSYLEKNIKDLTKELRYDIELIFIDCKTECVIRICSTQIKRIFKNIINNVNDSIKNKGKLIISIKNITIDKNNNNNNLVIFPGEYVLITIVDTGCGISKKNLNKVFDPFFSTKDLNIRSGLGLSIVYGIVKQNKGFITINSKINKGTTLKIYFPRVNE